jgi:hypothetical protein
VSPLFRARTDFEPTLRTAAEQLNVPPIVLEKDYWITQVLRHISKEFPNDFIFKGGTSLSKGYSLINRFSEDLDLLIVPGDRGRNPVDKLMKKMASSAAEHVGGERHSEGFPDTGRSRTYKVTYEGLIEETQLISHGVLMEMGVRGGPQPCQAKSIGSLLESALSGAGEDTAEYDDLASFEVQLLHPGRTLLEKLSMVHRESLRLQKPDTEPKPNVGRHFFDLYFLLRDEGVLGFLDDRALVEEVLIDIQLVTDRYFSTQGPPETRPSEGFAASPAFDGSSPSLQLRKSYYDTMPELHFGDDLPDWAAICELVRDHAALL